MGVITNRYLASLALKTRESLLANTTPGYVFVGRPIPWDDDQSPPTANLSPASVEHLVYPQISYGKKLQDEDLVPMVPRHDWVSNTTYDMYDQEDANLHSKSFYVVTDESAVFKCIYNANGNPSTIKPAIYSTDGFFRSSDGYVWKYMFSFTSTMNAKHYSTSFVPVTPNSDVEENAVDGAIAHVKINSAGQGYTAHSRGYLGYVVNSSAVSLSSNSSSASGAYTGAGIYLRSNPGGSQLSKISSYVGGSSRLAVLDPALDIYVTLLLSFPTGTFVIGDIATQKVTTLGSSTIKGNFAYGDVVQQSDSAPLGVVQSSNSTSIVVYPTTNTQFSNSTPVYVTSASGSLKIGNASIVTGQSNVTGDGTTFTSDYLPGTYIRVGSVANTQIRRISSIANDAHMTVAQAFTQTLTANIHYLVPNALTPSSITDSVANGVIDYVNIDGQIVEFSNTLISDLRFILGETVTEVNANGDSQSVTGVVDYANDTHVILSDLSGSLSANLFLLGDSSQQKAQIDEFESYPAIGVLANRSDFKAGWPVYANSVSNSVQVANGQVIGVTPFPGELSEYIIGPQVIITGDGSGATAYATVSSNGSLANSIESVTVLTPGLGYTIANVIISANAFGNGANLSAMIGPTGGHGSNAYMELGARYLGVSQEFKVHADELYRLPANGEYRTVGVIQTPLWSNVRLTIGDYLRTSLTLSSPVGTFTPGEVALQYGANAAGTVEWANTTYLELSKPSGTFLTTGLPIYGLESNAVANVDGWANIQFSSNDSSLSLVQEVTGATMKMTEGGSSGYVDVANVQGILGNTYAIYNPVTNAYANVTGISTGNATVSDGATFGDRFSQHMRVALTVNTGPFTLTERVVQDSSNASGVVFATNSDIDLIVSNSTGTFFQGNEVDSNTGGGSAIVAGVGNSTHLKLTGLSGTWEVGDYVINKVGVEAYINSVYPALVLTDVRGNLLESSLPIIGDESQSLGRASHANSVTYPDLTRDTGTVLYASHQSPFERQANTRQQLKLVLKF